jgi:polar amino acid transport system substrate-binding protein
MKAIPLVLALVLALAGCSTITDPIGSQPAPKGVTPMPAGATTVTSLPAASADTSCDPTASLRPTGPPPAPGAFSGYPTLATIYGRGRLIVGVDQNTLRFGFRDPRTGELDGFDISMAREIAKAIFGDPNKIQFRVLTSAQRIPALQNNEVDIVVETMTINCERRKDVEFSQVYYEAGQRVLVKENSEYTGIDSLGGKKVCAAKGSTSLANVVNRPVKPVGMQVAGWTDCLVMLQQNQVEAVSTDDTILAGLRAQDPFTKIVGERFTSEPYGMAMRKDQTDFVRFVNSVLEQLRANGTWTALYNRWVAELLPDVPAVQPQAKYRD